MIANIPFLTKALPFNFCKMSIFLVLLHMGADHTWSIDFYVLTGESGRELEGASEDDFLRVRVDQNKCYCCTIDSSGGNTPFFSKVEASRESIGFFSVHPFVVRSDADPSPFGHRVCFNSPYTDEAARMRMTISNLPSPPDKVYARCSETTLYGGFNISSTPFNFLEIVSTTENNQQDDGVVNALITVKDSVSNQTVLNKLPISNISAGSRKDVDIHTRVRSVVGDANTSPVVFGSAYLCHDGAPGALSVTLSQYDSALNLVNQQVFKSRNQLSGGN